MGVGSGGENIFCEIVRMILSKSKCKRDLIMIAAMIIHATGGSRSIVLSNGREDRFFYIYLRYFI